MLLVQNQDCEPFAMTLIFCGDSFRYGFLCIFRMCRSHRITYHRVTGYIIIFQERTVTIYKLSVPHNVLEQEGRYTVKLSLSRGNSRGLR